MIISPLYTYARMYNGDKKRLMVLQEFLQSKKEPVVLRRHLASQLIIRSGLFILTRWVRHSNINQWKQDKEVQVVWHQPRKGKKFAEWVLGKRLQAWKIVKGDFQGMRVYKNTFRKIESIGLLQTLQKSTKTWIGSLIRSIYFKSALWWYME